MCLLLYFLQSRKILKIEYVENVMKALITGITGQDGCYLAELLLQKGYEAHALERWSSLLSSQLTDHINQDLDTEYSRVKLHYGALSDTSNFTSILRDIEPDEVYNLGAQSHVAVSFF